MLNLMNFQVSTITTPPKTINTPPPTTPTIPAKTEPLDIFSIFKKVVPENKLDIGFILLGIVGSIVIWFSVKDDKINEFKDIIKDIEKTLKV